MNSGRLPHWRVCPCHRCVPSYCLTADGNLELAIGDGLWERSAGARSATSGHDHAFLTAMCGHGASIGSDTNQHRPARPSTYANGELAQAALHGIERHCGARKSR